MECLDKLNHNLETLIQSLSVHRKDPIIAGIVIPTYNRPEYVKRCFDSLKSSDLKGVVVVIVDDGSGNHETKNMVNGLGLCNVVNKIMKPRNRGMHDSFVQGFDYLGNHFPDIKIFITLDSDTIHKPHWCQQIISLFNKYKDLNGKEPLVTGFNTTSHTVLETYDDYHVKRSCGGVNMLFSKDFYQRFARNSFTRHRNGWDWDVVSACNNNGIPILCTKPSVIEHIGANGIHSKSQKYDVAVDF